MGKIKIVATKVNIDNHNGRDQYRAIFTYPGGRIFRRLGIEAAAGARVEKGMVIIGEPPEKVAQIWNAATIMSNQLGDEGAFSARGRYLFTNAMNEFLSWHKAHRNDPKIYSKAKPSLKKFGACRLNMVSRDEVRKWIESISGRYNEYGLRNVIAAPKAMYNWLQREGKYDGKNPFSGHDLKSRGGTFHDIKPVISAEEFTLIKNLIAGDASIEQAVILAYFTGLRPSEVYRINAADFDHDALILRVKEQKTRQGVRLIAVPQTLSTWALNHQWGDLKESAVSYRIKHLKSSHPAFAGLSMASFRKNFAALMEYTGADHEAIDAHQGRFQGAVIARHYLRDKMRSVRLLRPFITKAFDGDDAQVLRVLK